MAGRASKKTEKSKARAPAAGGTKTTGARRRSAAGPPLRLVRFTRQSILGAHPVWVNPANVLWVDALPDPVEAVPIPGEPPLPGAPAVKGGAAIYVNGGTMLPLVVSESIDEVVAKLDGAAST